jgi:hypothetical protein
MMHKLTEKILHPHRHADEEEKGHPAEVVVDEHAEHHHDKTVHKDKTTTHHHDHVHTDKCAATHIVDEGVVKKDTIVQYVHFHYFFSFYSSLLSPSLIPTHQIEGLQLLTRRSA